MGAIHPTVYRAASVGEVIFKEQQSCYGLGHAGYSASAEVSFCPREGNVRTHSAAYARLNRSMVGKEAVAPPGQCDGFSNGLTNLSGAKAHCSCNVVLLRIRLY